MNLDDRLEEHFRTAAAWQYAGHLDWKLISNTAETFSLSRDFHFQNTHDSVGFAALVLEVDGMKAISHEINLRRDCVTVNLHILPSTDTIEPLFELAEQCEEIFRQTTAL